MRYKYLILFIFLFIPVEEDAFSCSASFQFPIVSGDLMTEEGSPFPGNKVFRLGEGNQGTVYRIEDPSNAHGQEVKIYKTIRRGWERDLQKFNFVSDAQRNQEKDAMLLKLFRGHPQNAFRIPDIETTHISGQPAIIFKNSIYGKSVFDVYRDDKIDTRLRELIVKDYVKRIKIFHSYLVQSFKGQGEVKVDPNATDAHILPYLDMDITFDLPNGEGTQYTPIHIAADGVIVSAVDLSQELRDSN